MSRLAVIEFDYDFADAPPVDAFAATPIAEVRDGEGRRLIAVLARRSGPASPLEWTLESGDSARSSWVEVHELLQEVRIEWSPASEENSGHVAVVLDGRLALWVNGFASAPLPESATLSRRSPILDR